MLIVIKQFAKEEHSEDVVFNLFKQVIGEYGNLTTNTTERY